MVIRVFGIRTLYEAAGTVAPDGTGYVYCGLVVIMRCIFYQYCDTGCDLFCNLCASQKKNVFHSLCGICYLRRGRIYV